MNSQMIKELSEAFGPSGFEEEVVDVVASYATPLTYEVDAMNNVYVYLNPHDPNKPTLMLDAHLDEVGFMVQSIHANGLIAMAPLGGWVPSNVPAHTVHIKTQSGDKVKGIIASKPPHFMSDAEKSAPLVLENLLIDVGVTSRCEVVERLGIQPGDPIAPEVAFSENTSTGVLFGKAFDNRLGCACVLQTLLELKSHTDLPFNVVGAFAAQEEVGTRGAQVTAQVVKPDVAIVFEGSPADDLYYDAYQSQGALKKGVQIRHRDASYISHRRFIDAAKKMADQKNIPYQSAVRHKGGTNAGKIHLQNKAVPVLVLGVPSRYVHTHYNYAATEDFNAAVALAKQVALHLDIDALTHRVK